MKTTQTLQFEQMQNVLHLLSSNSNKEITIDELHGYAEKQFDNIAEQILGNAQIDQILQRNNFASGRAIAAKMRRAKVKIAQKMLDVEEFSDLVRERIHNYVLAGADELFVDENQKIIERNDQGIRELADMIKVIDNADLENDNRIYKLDVDMEEFTVNYELATPSELYNRINLNH